MDPSTLAMERLAAEWAALMAGLGSLAVWGGVGLIALMATTVLLAALFPSSRGRDDSATTRSGRQRRAAGPSPRRRRRHHPRLPHPREGTAAVLVRRPSRRGCPGAQGPRAAHPAGRQHPHRRADGRPWPHKIHELSSGAAVVAKVFEIDDLLIAVTSAITGARGVASTRRYAALGGGRIVSRRSIRVATSPARVPERAPTAGWKDTIALSRLRPSFSARSSLAAASTAAMFVANVHHVVKMVLPIVGGSTPD